jgi:hypothetical protein
MTSVPVCVVQFGGKFRPVASPVRSCKLVKARNLWIVGPGQNLVGITGGEGGKRL